MNLTRLLPLALFLAPHAAAAPQAGVDTVHASAAEGWDAGFGLRGPRGSVEHVHVFGGRIAFAERVSQMSLPPAGFVHLWDPRTGATESSQIVGDLDPPEIHDFATWDASFGRVLLMGGHLKGVLSGFPGIDGLAMYDGTAWRPFSMPAGRHVAHRLATNGPELFVYAADFYFASIFTIHRFDGSAWETLGGRRPPPRDLEYSTAGGSGALYALESSFEPLQRYSVANGAWEPFPTPVANPVTLAHYDAGVPLLVVGGDSELMAWDGSSWSTLGGVPGPAGVRDLAVRKRDGADVLYACGSFQSIGAMPAARLALWNGAAWQEVGGGVDATAVSVAVDPPMRGVALAGSFLASGTGLAVPRIAHWDRSGWRPFQDGEGLVRDIPSTFGEGRVVEALDRGAGPELFVGGEWRHAGSSPTPGVAVWSGSAWQSLGEGLDGNVISLEVFDGGSGPALWAGSGFSTSRLATFDGGAWQTVPGVDGSVYALQVFDDGSGPKLHAAGSFTMVDGVPALRIARFDGTSWSPVGAGATDGLTLFSLAVHDDGSGPALYASGDFTTIGGVPAEGVARWDGTSWSAVGGLTGGLVLTLESVDLPALGGSRLVAGGSFRDDGLGNPLGGVAAWDGTSWSDLGGGFAPQITGTLFVDSFAVFDEGSGPRLVAGGEFELTSGLGRNLARLEGGTWEPVPGALSGRARSLAIFEDDLWVAGRMGFVRGRESLGVARRFSVPGTIEEATPGGAPGPRR